MPLATGTRMGPYELVAVIGAGGIGEAYRARDARLRRDVAIKVLGAAPGRGRWAGRPKLARLVLWIRMPE